MSDGILQRLTWDEAERLCQERVRNLELKYNRHHATLVKENEKLTEALAYEGKVNKNLRAKLHTLAQACRAWAGEDEPGAPAWLPRRVARALKEIDE